jgi:Ca-activated chloride channel family protein
VDFQSPLLLVLLLVVPLSALAYRAHARRSERATAAFAAPAVLPSVAPRRPRWRRHLPYAAYAVALTALVLAFARPEITVAVPDERASIVLATDTSGSMQATDVPPSRLETAREAGLDFADDVPDEVRVGAVVFNHRVRSIEAPTTDRESVRQALERLRPSGGTATGEALAAALGLVERSDTGGRPAPAAIVLLSDGASTHGRDPLPLARRAARLHIPIYTVALGTDSGTIQVERSDGESVTRHVPPDRETMRRIATLSGGRTFAADAGDELATVYERLGSRVATREERRQVTAAFAGGAAALLLLGGALSLRWFGRLP